MGEKKSKSDIVIVILIILVIILITLVSLELFAGFFSKRVQALKEKKEQHVSSIGNTIGNIRNYGYVTCDNDYLYYMCPNERATGIGIRKRNKNNLGGGYKTLIEDNWKIVSLNYMDGYIYFITMEDFPDENSEDLVNNRIHKLKTDGTEHFIINDNEFHNECAEIYVIKDKIYYIGEDGCIYYMDLNGENKTKLNDDGFGYLGVTEDYIFYNKVTEYDEEAKKVLDYVTYMMNIDGTNQHPVIENEKLFDINIVGDYIYYMDKERHVSRAKLDGTEKTLLSDQTVYNLNVTDEGIFYFNNLHVEDKHVGVAVYKMSLDGKNVKLLTRLEDESESLCEFDNWLYYTDKNETEGTFSLISKDGVQKIQLYKLDFTQFKTIDKDSPDIVSQPDEE